MLLTRTEWTNDLAKQWDATLQEPHMQAGILELQRQCRAKEIPLAHGHDALVVAAAEHHRRVGQQEVLDAIEDMRKEVIKRKQLPQPWTPESRGEKPITERIP